MDRLTIALAILAVIFGLFVYGARRLAAAADAIPKLTQRLSRIQKDNQHDAERVVDGEV